MYPIIFKKPDVDRLVFAVSILSIVLTAVVCLHEYLSQQLFNLALGALAMPFALRIRTDKKGSYRFAVAALCFMALSFYAPVSTLVYFSLIAVLLFAAESRFGRINFLAVTTVVLTMPLVTYWVNIFSFPIRLRLTSVCGYVFRTAGIPMETAGNTFILAGDEFTVDPACMGLNMLIASLLVGIMLIGFRRKKSGKDRSAGVVAAYLTMIVLLNIFSNLVRMLLLVMFRIYPDTAMHDVVGIVCFLVQVVLPAWAVSGLLFPVHSPEVKGSGSTHFSSISIIKEPGIKNTDTGLPRPSGERAGRWGLPVCCGLLWMVALHVSGIKERDEPPASVAEIPGYTAAPYAQGVIKLSNDKSLVYIKRIRWFCDTEHNPTLCWSGSGYTMSRVRETTSGELGMYTAVLQKDNDVLYTAWWYDNGLTATTEQFRWRRDMLFGAPAYSLINVTVADEKTLETETAKIAALLSENRKSIGENCLSANRHPQ